ncbi:hypothetical protein AVV66_gp221 [Escherichia phage vB_EcoM_VR26]|uniref:Uncharacterized protein n=2 Tax=Gaprivervirus TaxID=1913654 RepID=A0A0A7HDT0_9CAUD|nr:gp30.3 hypothetical protein [Escherichia phage vB_EcoM_VR7]YP_009214053.1 hypothetical protein AVV66_gp221 [Escherichia phage vB_EcoM_VR26]ADR32592.1 gp30.3 hypothetical protein [Escherichia phage vB_EcoM_VR7]AIZ02853.1 hypothetical protein VR26_216 [Escherichia phage vB_EcoM_VR26]
MNNKNVYLGCPGWSHNKLEELMQELRTVGRFSGLEFPFQDTLQHGKSCIQVHILKQLSKTKDSATHYKLQRAKF